MQDVQKLRKMFKNYEIVGFAIILRWHKNYEIGEIDEFYTTYKAFLHLKQCP